MPDLIESVARLLYLFDGSEAVADERARETEDIYRRRATSIVALVRDHDTCETCGDRGWVTNGGSLYDGSVEQLPCP